MTDRPKIERDERSLWITDIGGERLQAFQSDGPYYVAAIRVHQRAAGLDRESTEALRDQLTEWLDRPTQAEPGAGARVKDRDGDFWVRHKSRWWCISTTTATRDWVELNRLLGPLTIQYPDEWWKATCDCGAVYGGRQEHCPSCHHTFTSTRAGDMHRVGDHHVSAGPNRRRCLDEGEMAAKGLTHTTSGWSRGRTWEEA